MINLTFYLYLIEKGTSADTLKNTKSGQRILKT